MIVKRGKNAYQYQSSRVRQQHRQREQELQRLNEELETALKMIKITERAYLLLAGFYERKSEIRKLQEEHCV